MVHEYSLTGKVWSLPNTQTDAMDIVAQLIEARGLTGDGSMTDISAFADFAKACELIQHAVNTKQKIAIFGDYDCDGITGTAQVAKMLRRRGADPVLRLPHRKNEGYGLKDVHMEELKEQGVRLLITVDTGVSCPGPIAQARACGMKTIILDHHRIPAKPAEPDALLHPGISMKGERGQPSAAGLCFAFVLGYEMHDGNEVWESYEEDLVLATVGTVADLVPLVGVNRSLVRAGLHTIPSLQGQFAEFLERAGAGKGATARDLAFRVAPRINAAGRMDDPMIALRGLLGDTNALQQLDTLNASRQEFVQELLENSLSLIDFGRPLIASVSELYTPGVVGLIAGRLTEQHGKPSLIAHREGDVCTASLRSISRYDITAGLTRIAHLLTSFGGHAQAAGCTFSHERFEEIVDALNADICNELGTDPLVPVLSIDAVLDARHVTSRLCEALTALEPFGQENPEPRFVIPNATLTDVKICGSEKNHLQFRIGPVKGIGFRLGHLLPHLSAEQKFDVACRLSINIWNGQKYPQFFVDDIRIAVPSSVPVTSSAL